MLVGVDHGGEDPADVVRVAHARDVDELAEGDRQTEGSVADGAGDVNQVAGLRAEAVHRLAGGDVADGGQRQRDRAGGGGGVAAQQRRTVLCLVGGEAGVQRALTLLRDEIDRDMALLGIRSIGEISSDLVRKL